MSWSLLGYLEVHLPRSLEEDFPSEVFGQGELCHDEIDATVIEMEPEALVEGGTNRAVAIEVFCPACGSICVDRMLESQMITYDLVGHIVLCFDCKYEN